MERTKHPERIWKIAAIAAAVCLLIAACALYLCVREMRESAWRASVAGEGVLISPTPEPTAEPTPQPTDPPKQEPEPEPKPGPAVSGEEALSLWNDEAAAKIALIDYVEAVTDPAGTDFIPADRRIAVFDMDGTVCCETDPQYFDYCLLRHRVEEDPAYKDEASDFEREVAAKIDRLIETGENAKGLEVDHGRAVASAFAGMTIGEFTEYVQAFRDTPSPSYEGMTRGEAFYRPMLQVIDYLQANGFEVWIVSGTDRLIVRAYVEGMLPIPPSRLIGSDETLVSDHQEGADGLNYVFGEEDRVVLGGDFVVKNLKMNKVSVIAREIGVQPVLSFGNSTGDASMAQYVIHGNPYRSMAVMLCCDDLERENGNAEKANSMFALCDTYGWVPVSMKLDWKTIYGDGVTYRPAK